MESKVYTASPGELVQLLYEASLEAVHAAIDAVDRGDIAARARAITKATSCVMELAGSLNVAAAGELGVRLAALYEYLLHELLEANVRQSAEPLRNCDRVLSSLLEGWTAALAQMSQAAAAEYAAEPSGTDPEPGTPGVVPITAMPAPARFAPDPSESPSNEDNEEAFDIEDLQPAMNSWSG
jgi:flagellar protein FliS